MALLIEHRFAALPVVDGDRHVVGMFSESDALRAGSKVATVASAMTVPAEVVAPTADAATIATIMLGKNLRSIPVVAAGFLIGIVARRDLLRLLSTDDTAIEANIRRLLNRFVDSRGTWQVAVEEGDVEIRREFADSVEERIVAAIAGTVAGVRHVEVVPTSLEPTVQ
jgi:CBS domain-containing protein